MTNINTKLIILAILFKCLKFQITTVYDDSFSIVNKTFWTTIKKIGTLDDFIVINDPIRTNNQVGKFL